MYQPNLVPRETHHLRMTDLNSRGSRLDSTVAGSHQNRQNQRISNSNNNRNGRNYNGNNNNSSSSQNIYAPPLSSYSAAFLGAMKTTRTSEELFNLPMGSGQDQALDYISLEIANNLMHLKSLAYTGYNYIKPIGIGKTMKEMVENNEIQGILNEDDEEDDDEEEDDGMTRERQSGVNENNSHVQSFIVQADEDIAIAGDNVNDNSANGAGEIDLDAQIPDGDDFNLSYDNLVDDEESDLDENESRPDQMSGSGHLDLGGARRLVGSGTSGFELDYREAHTSMSRNNVEDEEFMAAEEYQDDHSISMDSSSIVEEYPGTGISASGVASSNNIQTGPTTATVSSISANSMNNQSGGVPATNSTDLTSPPTASILLQYASHNNPYYTPSHLRNEQHDTSQSDMNESDYDMIIE